MNKMTWLLAVVLSSVFSPSVAQAVSKEAQELMALREKHAPVNCELTKLYRQLGEARQAKNDAKARALTEQMQTLDKKLSVDKARMEELRKKIRNTPDYPAILEQQVKFDKECNKQPSHP
jgi:Skp family chaperone for outer membrane proteins